MDIKLFQKNPLYRQYIYMGVFVMMIMTLGFFVGQVISKNKETKINAEMYRLVRTFSNLIDSSKYTTIKSDPIDNQNADYMHIRKQLIEIGKINKDVGVRWIYTLVPRDGQIVFSIDSVEGSDHSEPGDIYYDASQDFIKAVDRVWNLKETSFVSPYTDRWGTFISVLTPILDSSGNNVVGVMAIDLDYFHFYKKQITEAKQLPFVITFLMALIFVLVRLNKIFAQKKDKEYLDSIIGQEKHAEDMVIERTKELSDEKSRLLASINSLSFGFIIIDLNHKIIFKNKVISDMFNLIENKEFFLENITSLLEKGNFIEKQVELCLKEKSVCKVKDIIFDKKVLHGVISPITTENDNKLIGYVFMLEDVTEAIAIERSHNEFFSIASHELRTPLTAIRGNSQMLKDDYKDKISDTDIIEMISDIHESSLRLIDIVNDFLEVSRLEQGKVQIKKEGFEISFLVNKILKDMDDIIHKSGLHVVLDIPDNLPKVFSDKAKVEQILINLIGNSLKFTKKGSITIKIEKTDNFLKVIVSDTGIGISTINQSLLFRKFQQAGEQILARDFTKGTGLGLYICHLLISNLGGSIGLVKSVLGEGSTFAFTLPIE